METEEVKKLYKPLAAFLYFYLKFSHLPMFVLRSPPQLVLFVEDGVLFSLWTQHIITHPLLHVYV